MKRTRFALLPLAAALALGALAACDGDPSGRGNPGPVSATLVSPNADDGAVLLEFSGGVRDVSVPGGQAFVREGSPARALLVVGTPGAIQFSVLLDDVARRPEVTVLEVADGQSRVRAGTAGYRVEFAQ